MNIFSIVALSRERDLVADLLCISLRRGEMNFLTGSFDAGVHDDFFGLRGIFPKEIPDFRRCESSCAEKLSVVFACETWCPAQDGNSGG
jgi:hypothetical protein